jgi:hypothetical protein
LLLFIHEQSPETSLTGCGLESVKHFCFGTSRTLALQENAGFAAINPFGRNMFTKEAVSWIEVGPGSTFQLCYAAFIHETGKETDDQPENAWKLFEPRTGE